MTVKSTIPKFRNGLLNHEIRKLYRLRTLPVLTEMFDILDSIQFYKRFENLLLIKKGDGLTRQVIVE